MTETIAPNDDLRAWLQGSLAMNSIRVKMGGDDVGEYYRAALANLDALAASQAETEDWKANAQRENAMLVQAQQRIAELEQEREDVRRVEAWLLEDYEGRLLYPEHPRDSNKRFGIVQDGRTQKRADSLAALGRMLKEANDAK